ncbi:MAG: MFS transporter [Elusimicrobiota bacterium]
MKSFGQNKKTLFSWTLYDFANSAFSTTVLSVVFSAYFVKSIVPQEGIKWRDLEIPGESVWSYLISGIMILAIFVSPLLGIKADQNNSRAKPLFFWTLLGSFSTMALFFAHPGDLIWACAWSFLAVFSFEMSQVFYNSFLQVVINKENTGSVSGRGFAWGYLGGGLCLALNLWMMNQPQTFGLLDLDNTLPVRASVLVAGIWWLLFSIPAFCFLRDNPQREVPLENTSPPLWEAFAYLKRMLVSLKKSPELKNFFIAYFFYNDGVQTIILMASIFGAKILGMSSSTLVLCFLFIQAVALAGALFMGKLTDRWGAKRVITVCIVGYLVVTFWGALMTTEIEFWFLGFCIGIIMGGIQSASRALFNSLIPVERTSEFFSLYGIVGKAASVMGPLVFGVFSQFGGVRWGVASLGIFFVVGLAYMRRVD